MKKKNPSSERNKLEKDDKKRGIVHSQPDNLRSCISFFINYSFIWALTLLLFYAVAYPLRENNAAYRANYDFYKTTRDTYSLWLKTENSNEELIKAMQDYYFVHFTDTIKEKFNEANETDFTIEHIYNIQMYSLPMNPTPSDYQTDYFSYVLKEDGSVNPDVVGYARVDDLNSRGLTALHDTIYSSYQVLEVRTREFIPKYKESIDIHFLSLGLSHIAPFALAMLINYIVLPLIFGHGAGLGEKITKQGYANKGNGYSASFFKLPLKMLILAAPASIGVFYFNPFYVVLFLVFPYFLDLLYRAFSSGHYSVADKFVFLRLVDLDYEKLYKNEAELLQDGETVLMGYSEEYTSTLSNVETMSFEDRGDGAH
ncbi:MAG: hypothetical protein K6B65_04830 [Bacilli bacterium]|nr:hypothetical protein [Bacilli bacterium]